MAWRFNRVDSKVQLVDHAALTLPDGDWTIAGWLKLDAHDSTKHQYFLSWGAYAAQPSLNWWFVHTTNQLQLYSIDDDGTALDGVVSASTPGTSTIWQHLLLQRLGNTVTQYIDGVADGADLDAAYDGVNVGSNLYFGGRSVDPADRWLGGEMAEWAKWDRALDAAERGGLVKGYSPLCYPGRKWCVTMVREYQELIVPLTVTNTGSTVARHPPTIYPFGPQQLSVPAVWLDREWPRGVSRGVLRGVA